MPTPTELRRARARFARARRVEIWYGRELRGIAEQIRRIIRGFNFEDASAVDALNRTLSGYSLVLQPWAEAVGRRMVEDVAARDAKAWFETGREIGRHLRREIATAPTGLAMRQSLDSQVGLIMSLPKEAAERVHNLTLEALTSGRRAADIADEILKTADIARHRANTIARTEVSRTATELTKARAEHVGSIGAIWRTSKDADVRKEHRRLEGVYFQWRDPPIAGPKGERYLPGAGPNCRCYAEVVL